MRKTLFWFGWGVIFLLPVAFVTEVIVKQDLPKIAPWQWAIPLAAIVLIYFSRSRDDVLKHRVV